MNMIKEESNWRSKAMLIEHGVVIGGLIGVQCIYAGNAILLSYLLSLNLNPLSLITFSAFTTFLLLSPISFIFEREQWPTKLSIKLIIQLVLISFSGVTLYQCLLLTGLKMTSPAMSTAMPNLAPALIFAIAWAFRFEKVDLKCIYSKVKIIGTIICVAGAIAMSLLQSKTSTTSSSPPALTSAAAISLTETTASDVSIFDKDKIIGCLYLITAVIVLSSNMVLQAHTLIEFPAPISLCAITALIGVGTTALAEFIQLHKFETGWPVVSLGQLIGFSLLLGMVTGVCVSFNGWAMKKRGPVLVSMFSPISTVVSAVLSVITLGERVSLGSLGGMFLMFTGLYFVLWAKSKETLVPAVLVEYGIDPLEHEAENEKPLLY